MGFRPLLFVHDMEIIKHISSSKEFLGRGQSHAHLELFKNKGIIFSNDEEHHKVHRAVVLKGLMKTSYLKGVAETVSEIINRQFKIWSSQHDISQEKSINVPVLKSLSAVTLDIIGIAGFSTELKAIEGTRSAYQDALGTFFGNFLFFARRPYFSKYIFFRSWLRLKKSLKALQSFSFEIVQKRRDSKDSSEHNDFLQVLLSENDPRTGKGFSDEDIFYDIQDLLAAGHDTTSNTVTFALYLLAQNPNVQLRLQEESDRFPEQPSYEDTGRMEVAHAVIKETLRIYAVVPLLFRRASKPTKIKLSDGREILLPVQANLIFSMHCLGRDEKLFENPEKFDIDRWLSKEEEVSPAWIPFGIGARNCVGARMAIMESKVMLCKIMQKYSVRPDPNQNGPLETETVLTLRPKNLNLLFFPRISTNDHV